MLVKSATGVTWKHKAITWTTDNFSSVGSPWCAPEENFIGICSRTQLLQCVWSYKFKITATYLWGQWVNLCLSTENFICLAKNEDLHVYIAIQILVTPNDFFREGPNVTKLFVPKYTSHSSCRLNWFHCLVSLQWMINTFYHYSMSYYKCICCHHSWQYWVNAEGCVTPVLQYFNSSRLSDA